MIIIPDPNEDIELSEKSAKEFKDATESIERAGSLGVYTQLITLVTALFSFATDPRIETVMKFLNLFNDFFRAAASEDAGGIAEKLFTDDNIDWLKKIAEAFYEASAAGGTLNVSINNITRDWEELTRITTDFVTEILKLTKPFKDAATEISKTNTELTKIKNTMKAITDIDLSDWLEDLLEKLEG